MANDILQIAEFEFAAWKFLSAVYQFRWKELIANKDNRSFRQCVSLQFNKIPTKNITTSKPAKNKQADISRVHLPIYFRFSKSMLAKSKFYKKNQSSRSASKSKNWPYI